MTSPSPPPAGHPSALALHEYHLALLPRLDADDVARHVTACDRCREEIEALEAEHRRFDREVFPATREAIARRGTGRGWLRFTLPSLALLAAAGAGLFLLVPRLQRDPLDAEIGVKGQGLLAVFVARGEGVLEVEDGKTRLRAGDRIRFVVRPAGSAFALIAGIDGAGRPTIYHPFGGLESAPLPPGPRVEIPGAIRLDDSAGPERVFALLSARPLPAAAVLQALEKLAQQGSAAVRRTERLPLHGVGVVQQQSILLEKTP
jgi:hypothetical protein